MSIFCKNSIKAHKLEKNIPMRVIVSTIGTPNNYMQNLGKDAIELALTFGIAHKTFRLYTPDLEVEIMLLNF